MRILIDLESGEVRTWAGAAITSLPAKFRDNVPLEVRFSLGGITQELAAGYSGQAGVKAAGEYAGDFLALDSAWVKSGTGTGTVYTFDLNLNTVEFATAFAADPASVAAVLEVQITDGSTVRSSQAVPFFVNNTYVDSAADPVVANPDLKATQAEAEAGTNNAHWMTPLRAAQAIAVLSPGAAHNLGSIGASASETLTLDLANGSRQYGYVANVVNDLTIDTPVGTPAEMDEVNLVLQWTDGITLAFDAYIGIPTDSAITLPKTLTAWRSYRIKLEFFGGRWNLVSLVGGFVESLD